MKIAIFTECYKPVMNGVAVSIETFKKGLEANGHEVFVFAPDHPDALVEHNVYRFPAIADKKKRLYPIIVPSINLEKQYLPLDILKDVDIIHAQHMFTAGRLARYVARKLNKPLIYTYHTLIFEYVHYLGLLAPIGRAYLVNMSKRFCNTCDQVITPSRSMKKILLKIGIEVPIEVIPTGIDPKMYSRPKKEESDLLKEKYKIPKDKKILLYLSRVAREKNIGFLLQAFKEIINEYPHCHLVIAGGGPEEEWLKDEVSKLGISDSVTLTGMLPKEEANKMFGVGDIFTFPSYTETQGIVVTEAMAAGTPPVAINKMGPTDLIADGENGYLTKLQVGDFSEKVLKLLKDNDLRNRFATEGLRRVEEFSNQASVAKLISLYEKVMQKKCSDTREEGGTLGEGIAHS